MGGHSYALFHEEPGWKKLWHKKVDYRQTGLLVGGVTAFAVCNQYYLRVRTERANNRDQAFMQIKNSFGTLHPDHKAFHEQRFGPIGGRKD